MVFGLRPHPYTAPRRIRAGELTRYLARPTIDLDPVHIVDRRVFVKRVDFNAVDIPGGLALRRTGHMGVALEFLLVALHVDAAHGAERIADGAGALLLDLVPAEVGAHFAL